MSSNRLILGHPVLSPSIFPSIRIFSNKSVCIRWPKYWSFSFNTSPSNEYSGLIFFRMDQFDLLAVQGILKNLLQHYSSKAKILRCPAFFIVQLSHPYMTTGKTIALTRQTFIGKVMCLLFNMLSRLVITFLPRSKHLLIPWLQSPSADFEAPQNKICVTVSTLSPSISHEVYKGSIFFHVFTNIYCYLSFWLCGSQQTGKFLNRWEPDHLTCLLRNLYTGQEGMVRNGYGTTECFKIGKGIYQGCILSPCLYNLHTECIIWNTWLDEA